MCIRDSTKRVQETKVQDPYSLRCVPQVHGASRDSLSYVYDVVSREINAVTDNPIVFPDEDEVISGGNFHGQPMALAFDFMKIAIAEYANISERRSERMINPALSENLPGFLTKHGGVCSGFMIAQYAAASMAVSYTHLVEDHLYMVEILIRKYLGKGVEYDDLYQVGALALVSAVERFDPDKGFEFSSFATPTILGEIKKYFRDKQWSLKVPRRLKEISAKVQDAKEKLSTELGKNPTIPEIARFTGLSDEPVSYTHLNIYKNNYANS